MKTDDIATIHDCRYNPTVMAVPQIRIERIFISPGHNFFGHHGQSAGTFPTVEVKEVKCIARKGLAGDRFFGYKENYTGQITFFSREIFDDVCVRLGVRGKSPEASNTYCVRFQR